MVNIMTCYSPFTISFTWLNLFVRVQQYKYKLFSESPLVAVAETSGLTKTRETY